MAANRGPGLSDVSLAALSADPYAVYARLRRDAPIAWIEPLGLWWVTRHDLVRRIILDSDRFTTGSTGSPIFDTFGEQMLTTEGDLHTRYRVPFQRMFTPKALNEALKASVAMTCNNLIDGFKDFGEVELRAGFASRLPVQTMLLAFGMPADAEPQVRRWYDVFERALANFEGDQTVRAAAAAAVSELHGFLFDALSRARQSPGLGLLGQIVSQVDLSDEAIVRNLSIILFGGISTVEALVLNTMWALHLHSHHLAAAIADPALIAGLVEETARWHSPVQSATRHVEEDVEIQGVQLRKGDLVNAMLGAANRDPRVFADPDRFDPLRATLRQHLAFATGPHLCLGSHLARLEAAAAVGALLRRLDGLKIDPTRSTAPEGYEFHQPRQLWVQWAPR